jgi:allophanate hydrolase subunit 2
MWGFLTVCALVGAGWVTGRSTIALALAHAVRNAYEQWLEVERFKVEEKTNRAGERYRLDNRRITIEESVLKEKEAAKAPIPPMPPMPPHIVAIKRAWEEEFVQDEIQRVIETTWRVTENWDQVASALSPWSTRTEV